MQTRTLPRRILSTVRSWLARAGSAYERVRRVLWIVLFTAFLALFLASNILPDRIQLVVGQPAPRDLPARFEFVDQPTTERLRREAAAAVPDVYTRDERSSELILRRVEEAFTEVTRIRAMAADDPAQRARVLRERLGLETLTDEAAGQVLQATDQALAMMREGALRIAGELVDAGIRPEELDAKRRQVPELVRALEFDRPYEQFVSLLVQSRLQPNLFYDEEATLAARQRAAEAVQPVLIRKGQIIVERGHLVTEADLIRLRDAGLLRDEGRLPVILGSLLLAVLVVGLTGGYLHLYNPQVLASESRVVLLGLVVLSTLLVSRVLLAVSGFAMPVAAGAMLLSILIDARVAIFAAVLLAALVALIAGGELQLFFVTLSGALVGVFSVTRVGQRSDLMRAGLYVGLANAGVVLTWNLLFGTLAVYDVSTWRDVFWALIAGFLSAVLTIGMLPFLESFFGILTPVRLLELANPNQPLLRRLLMEAPGTYHHSLMVANLSEAAAEQVGANSLLARVGAYYHDIGKMKRPYFFIENQFGNVNPHDKIAPNLSALIITSHVRDGVELAKEHGLPEELVKFIREHHGTMTVEYFYNKAMEDPSGQGVLEENFRYPGPIPRSRETAICMLADGAEAAVRAMTRPTPGRIEATVRKVIRDRLNAGQLDHCDLTLADLDRIAETFTQILTGLFHGRIEYPEALEKELEKARKTHPAARRAAATGGAPAGGTAAGGKSTGDEQPGGAGGRVSGAETAGTG